MDNNNMFSQEPQSFQTQQPYQQQYQQPYQQPYQNDNLEEPVSIGEWMLTSLIMMIPCVGLIMIFVWAFGGGNKSKANYFKAYLIWCLIGIGISLLTVIILAIMGASLFS